MATLAGFGVPPSGARIGAATVKMLFQSLRVLVRALSSGGLGAFTADFKPMHGPDIGAMLDMMEADGPVKAGQYPVYCALLYTTMPGLHEDVHWFIRRHAAEVDGMTSEACLVMAVENRTHQTRRGTRPLKRTEVFATARKLGVNTGQLPAAVFFCDWRGEPKKDAIRVQLGQLVEETESSRRRERLTDVFAALFTAVDAVAGMTDARARQTELDKRIARVSKDWVPSPNRVNAALTSTSAVRRWSPAFWRVRDHRWRPGLRHRTGGRGPGTSASGPNV